MTSIEHIRRRPDFYFGGYLKGNHPWNGLYTVLKEVIDDAVNEFLMGYGNNIELDFADQNREVTVKDHGRGIPFDSIIRMTSEFDPAFIKRDTDTFQQCIGWQCLGLLVANAMSESFRICSCRDCECFWAEFIRGELVGSGKETAKDFCSSGTVVTFKLDADFFGDFAFRMDYVKSMIKNYTYFRKGLIITLNHEDEFKSENGLLDLIHDNILESPLYPPIHLEDDKIEMVLCHYIGRKDTFLSFVNGHFTRNGGVHQTAFKSAVTNVLDEVLNEDYRLYSRGLLGAISVKVKNPDWGDSSKSVLTLHERNQVLSDEIDQFVSTHLQEYLCKNNDVLFSMAEVCKIFNAPFDDFLTDKLPL